MLIDVFKEVTNRLEGHCTVDDTNEIRAYVKKNCRSKKRAADNLKLLPYAEIGASL